ncbi:MAG: hypothetical protein RIS44_784 [Pseudomonadota bacterium]|jgi:uncharacterized protein (DUF1499 family)
MAWIKFASLLVVVVGVGLFVAGRIGLLRGTPPTDLGVKDGRLKPPSLTPNSVSSQTLLHADHPMLVYAQIAPLPLRGSGPQTLAALARLVEQTPGGRVVESSDNYLRAEFTSPMLRFVDDTEFWFDATNQRVDVRSASRLGRKDFGVNRGRVEALRDKLSALPNPA